MAQLDPAETEALAVDGDTARRIGEVASRDFREPRSLSSERLHEIDGQITSALQGISTDLVGPLRSFHKFTLASLREINVEHMFDDFKAPFIVHNFTIGGHLAWMVWDSTAAAKVVETVVSGPSTSNEEVEPRQLSSAEVSILSRILDVITVPICERLGLEAAPGTLAQDVDDLVTLRSANASADSRRLSVHLVIDGQVGQSELILYLPNVPGSPELIQETAEALPDHLDDVLLDVRAFLGAVDLPLHELLALEVGDVLPLGIDTDQTLDIYIEERACAKGHWGQVNGTLAVHLTQLDLRAGDIDCPAIR
ncbi:MAG: flagellar motor switch protein FliM [Planctomycetota bacterium]